MLISEPLLSPCPASTLCLASGQFKQEPAISWSRPDPWGRAHTEGSSCEKPLQSIYAAFGEFEERSFFTQQKLAKHPVQKPFPTSQQSESYSFFPAFREIAHRAGLETPAANRPLRWVPASRLGCRETVLIPEIVLSLEYDHPDREWLHLSDSLGCAGHPNPASAHRSALLEFAERQAMILSWLTGYAKSEWNLPTSDQIDQESRWIMDTLSRMGTLRILDLSPWDSLYIPQAVYSSAQGNPVQFSVSASAHTNPLMALRNTLLELWQSYHFIYTRAGGGLAPSDLFQQEFLQSNRPGTMAEFPAFAENSLPTLAPEDLPCRPQDLQALVEELSSVSDRIYTFWGSGGDARRPLAFAKVLSPDYFLHMWIPSTNLENRFLASSRREVINLQNLKPIPFP